MKASGALTTSLAEIIGKASRESKFSLQELTRRETCRHGRIDGLREILIFDGYGVVRAYKGYDVAFEDTFWL